MVQVIKMIIKIGDKEIELTIEEVKDLRDALNKIFPAPAPLPCWPDGGYTL